MKYILILTFTLFVFFVKGQNNSNTIHTELPQIIPPSPTVAALMKFEEVPVSTYTGVPDISIPLFDDEIMSNLFLNINLRYHTSNIKFESQPTEVGLGWSINTLGTISRTVQGIPDEYYIPEQKIGAFRNHPVTNNSLRNFLQNINSDQLISDNESMKEYMFNTRVKNIYDTQYDLWQFNFMGKTGKFIIQKNENGILEIKILDGNLDNLKITSSYILPSPQEPLNNHYKISEFKIVDEFGFEYVFNVIEKTTVDGSITSTSYYENEQINNLYNIYEFNSSFHLSEIWYQGNKLVQANYNKNVLEHKINTNTKNYYPLNIISFQAYVKNLVDSNLGCYDVSFLKSLFYPQYETNATTNSYNSKKITEIKVLNRSKIYFNYEENKLKTLEIKNWNDVKVKEYNFNYININFVQIRHLLKDIQQFDLSNNNLNLYQFEYKIPSINLENLKSDIWGYYTDKNDKKVSTDLMDSFSLRKITSATKGSTNFYFEPNSYSYIMNNPINDFSNNPMNWYSLNGLVNIYASNTLYNAISITNATNVVGFSFLSGQLNQTNDWGLELIDDNNQTFSLGSNISFSNNYFKFQINNLPIGNYRLRLNSFDFTNPIQSGGLSLNYKVDYLKEESNQLKYLIGGGIRIGRILYSPNQYESNSITKNFNYNFIENNSISSGALNHNEPIYQYNKVLTQPSIGCTLQGGSNIFDGMEILYRVTTNNNAINESINDSSPIGYKNVTIFQDTGIIDENFNLDFLGKTEYTYTNSIDFPDDTFANIPDLFIPTNSNSYKRGLLKKQVFYNKNLEVINQTTLDYDYFNENEKINYGVSLYTDYDINNVNPVHNLFSNYNHFKLAKDNNHCYSSGFNNVYCGLLSILNYYEIGIFKILNYYKGGYSKLKSEKTIESYQQNLNLIKEKNFNYSLVTKEITKTSTTTSTGDVLETNFSYAHEMNNQAMISKNMVNIPLKTETKRNGTVISTQEIKYKDWNPDATEMFLAPELIQSSKGTNPLETRVKYNKYDEFSNPLEVQQEGGMLISYIWGYNNTQPVAKLENIAYASIPANLITAIQTASNGTDEQAILTALNALRTHSALANAMITTYTFKPLVGVTSITDPKGDKITYHYDGFGRLESVKDKNGNKLSENEYHYRTQN